MQLQDKVALITGATRGIGSAVAVKLGEQGATVIGTATTAEGAERINGRLQQLGIKGGGFVLDVNDRQAIDSLLEQVSKLYSYPDILVNNAAVTRDNLLLRMKDDEWSTVMDTNLNSVFYLTKACVKHMLKARWGRIISLGSIVGTIGNPGQANYAAAKAALVGFTKSLAHEVASRNITGNVVAPGFIETDMTNVLPEEQRQQLLSKIPMQRLGQPDDIAAVVAFLASDQAQYITGQTIHVNGGMYMA